MKKKFNYLLIFMISILLIDNAYALEYVSCGYGSDIVDGIPVNNIDNIEKDNLEPSRNLMMDSNPHRTTRPIVFHELFPLHAARGHPGHAIPFCRRSNRIPFGRRRKYLLHTYRQCVQFPCKQ